MNFNSFVFLEFFLVVLAVYVGLRSRHRIQNLSLLAASYVFYGYWDARFLGLILLSTAIDYGCALGISASGSPRVRRRYLLLSVAANLGILGFFKYFNFFTDSFAALLRAGGARAEGFGLDIVLPVGISFYTFQSLSYTIDVYRGVAKPARSFTDFALYVAFFPQLVAGPIERARHLLPQIAAPRTIDAGSVNAGLYLLLFGFFKKLVIADNLARAVVEPVFADPSGFAGLDLALAAVAFSFQIYCDFSGYSDIARGVCKMMGFDLMINFKLPYFARSPREFWSRWHVSLSTWLRDYLYVPLGGNRGGRRRTQRNLFLTMLLGGLWHGAAWTFVLWGALHGAFLAAHRVLVDREIGDPAGRAPEPRWRAAAKIAGMNLFVIAAWILFRSESLGAAAAFYGGLSLVPGPSTAEFLRWIVFLCAPLLALDAWQSRAGDLLIVPKQRPVVLAALYAFFLVWIMIFGGGRPIEFIYFQF